MKYRFLGYPDKMFPDLVSGKIYELVVVTAFWSHKPRIVKPFYCPYSSWDKFYKNWRPMNVAIMKLEQFAKEEGVFQGE